MSNFSQHDPALINYPSILYLNLKLVEISFRGLHALDGSSRHTLDDEEIAQATLLNVQKA